MNGITRIYVEKKPGFDIEAQNLKSDLRFTLGLNDLTGVRIFKRYDVKGIEGDELERARRIVFSEPNCDTVSDTLPELANAFAVEYLPVSMTSAPILRRSAYSCSPKATGLRCAPQPYTRLKA